MVKNKNFVRVGAIGSIYVADLQDNNKPHLDPPTLSDPWDPQYWSEVGHISEDGISENYEDDAEDIKDMEGNIVRSLIKGTKASIKFAAMESSKGVFKLFYKTENIKEDSDGTIHVDISTPKPHQISVGLDLLDGTNMTRLYIPYAEVAERGELAHKSGEPTLYDLTVSAFTDEWDNLIYKSLGNIKKLITHVEKSGIVKGYGDECKPVLDGSTLTIGRGKILIKFNDEMRHMSSPVLSSVMHKEPKPEGNSFGKNDPETWYVYLTTDDVPHVVLNVDNKLTQLDNKASILICKFNIDDKDKITEFVDMRRYYESVGLESVKEKVGYGV